MTYKSVKKLILWVLTIPTVYYLYQSAFNIYYEYPGPSYTIVEHHLLFCSNELRDDLPVYIKKYAYDDNYIIVKGSECERNYDSVYIVRLDIPYYWIIDKKQERFIGPMDSAKFVNIRRAMRIQPPRFKGETYCSDFIWGLENVNNSKFIYNNDVDYKNTAKE